MSTPIEVTIDALELLAQLDDLDSLLRDDAGDYTTEYLSEVEYVLREQRMKLWQLVMEAIAH